MTSASRSSSTRRTLGLLAVAALAGGGLWMGLQQHLHREAPGLGRWHALIRSVAAEAQLEPALLAALVGAESGGDPNAKSHAGALGLAQLMPATAKEEATRRKLGTIEDADLFRPELNLRLGAFYLRRMLDQFDGELPFAIAAYNAGPGRMRRWLKAHGDKGLSPRALIDQHAFKETRRHVEKILRWQPVYAERLARSRAQ